MAANASATGRTLHTASTNQTLFEKEIVNGWSLWALITAPIGLAVIALMATKDLSNPDDISSMIQFSVRCSVPWLYLAFAASSLRVLFPGSFSLWALRNRTYLGLGFASGMAWQLLFIIWMTAGHWSYYILWATVVSTYWYELSYYDDIQPIDYVYYWTGLLAFALRAAAWIKPRLAQSTA